MESELPVITSAMCSDVAVLQRRLGKTRPHGSLTSIGLELVMSGAAIQSACTSADFPRLDIDFQKIGQFLELSGCKLGHIYPPTPLRGVRRDCRC